MSDETTQLPATQADAQAAADAQAHPPLRRGSRLWAVSAVFITAMLVFGGLAYVVIDTPRSMVRATAGMFDSGMQTVNAAMTPTVTVREAIRSAIGEIHKETRLVVMTAAVHVDIERSSEKRVLWDYLQLGTTTVRVRVPDNQVQYVIPLENFNENSVTYDETRDAVFIRVPMPEVDEDMVDVQSDRREWMEETDVGWGRFDMYSGEQLRDQVYASLRDEVIAEGRHPLLMERAKTHAEQAIRALFEPHLKETPATSVYVEFL